MSENKSKCSPNASKNNLKVKQKCVWCDKPRSRHDLCNRCRQKVESRARRLMEQKLTGDIVIIREMSTFISKNVDLNKLSTAQYHALRTEIEPLLVWNHFLYIFVINTLFFVLQKVVYVV